MTVFTSSAANTASNASVYFASRSRTRNRKEPARSPRSISRLRACCAAHAAVERAVTPRMCTVRVPTSITNSAWSLRRPTVSRWKKSAASIVGAENLIWPLQGM